MYDDEDSMPVFELQELADQIEIFLEEIKEMDVRKKYRRSFYDLPICS